MPQDFDAIGGEELPVAFKGAPLDIPPGFAWEWVSPSAAGWGDPLRRAPEAVQADVRAGLLSLADARRVYCVELTPEGELEQAATDAARLQARRARLGADDVGEVLPAPEGATPAGEMLCVLDGRWWCNGADLGPCSGSWKAGAAHEVLAFADVATELGGGDPEMAAKIELHAWYCPVSGYRLDLELVRAGEAPLVDMVLE